MQKNDFLELLDEPEIQNKLRKIIGQEETLLNENCQKYEEEIEMLKELLEKFKALWSNEQQKNENLSYEIEDIKQANKQAERSVQKLQDELLVTKDALEDYQKKFEKSVKAYELFMGLSEDTAFSLKGIFKEGSFNGFIACGVQEKNIESLWEYVKGEIIEDTNSDIASLITIYHFLLDTFLLAYPNYEILNVNRGDRFDPILHIATKDSQVSGMVQKVILHGYKNHKTNAIIKQTVVKV